MLSKRCISSLTPSEAQSLQWVRSGKCVRCFHASLRRRAEDDTKGKNDAGTPFNAPDRGPTRQQRSAMASREVEMLQRDRPHPTFNNPQPNTLRPAGAGQTVDPEAVGQDVGAGPMGHNDGPAREGPLSQGVDMSARTDVEAGADTRAAQGRSTGQPITMEDATERGGSGMETGKAEVRDERITRPPPEEEEDDDPDEEENGEEEDDDGEEPDAYTSNSVAVEGKDYVVTPEQMSKNELLFEQDGSTIAASNFEAVIAERLRTASEYDTQPRTTRLLARKFMRGQLVHFDSQEEKAAVLETAKSIAKRRAQNAAKSKKEDDADAVQEPPKEYKFSPLPENVQRSIVDKMVRGTYDEAGVLQGVGNGKYKHPALNNIARATAMNSTYLSSDGERFLKKVRSLLPAATSPTQATQGQKRKTG